MTKIEATLVGFFVGVMCPVSLFIFFWWVTASLVIYNLFPFDDGVIVAAAFTGLGVGILLDLKFLKTWVSDFFNADIRLMLGIYLFWSAIALAFMMGLPLGNIVLGCLAGIYIGRKVRHAAQSHERFAKAAKCVSLFTATV